MITGSCTARSNRQAAPERANHASIRSEGLRQVNKATGAATQTLRQLKQSISLPAEPLPRRARKRTTRSLGPSSFASKWVIRQVARTARRNLGQNPRSPRSSIIGRTRPEKLQHHNRFGAGRFYLLKSLQIQNGKKSST